jgi:hypothetical protein
MNRQLVGTHWCDLDATCGTYAQHSPKPDYVETLYLTSKNNWVMKRDWPDQPLEDWTTLDPADVVLWLIREKHEIPPCLETVLAKLEI